MNIRRYPPHDRAVLRSPLGVPSAAAMRFLEPAYPAEAFIQPDESLAKYGALIEAQRQAAPLHAANEAAASPPAPALEKAA